MASQVLSGSGNVTYTNNTGQNVRVVINYMGAGTVDLGYTSYPSISLSWSRTSGGTVAVDAPYIKAIGRNLAFSAGILGGPTTAIAVGLAANNMAMSDSAGAGAPIPLESYNNALPTEIMLSAGQTFSASCGAYNIVIIPEAG